MSQQKDKIIFLGSIKLSPELNVIAWPPSIDSGSGSLLMGLQRLGLLQLHLGGRPTFYPPKYVKFIFYKSDHAYEFPTKNYFHASIKKILW